MSKFLQKTRHNIVKHNSEILTGLGIAGMVASTILAIKFTPKALNILEKAQKTKSINQEDDTDLIEQPIDLTLVEKIKLTWKYYTPSIAIMMISSACLIGAVSINKRKTAILATAYTISETALREYQDKVVEKIGEKKEQIIRDDISQDKINNNPVINNEIYITDKGNTLCYDVISGRYFKSDIDNLKRVENDLNRQMRSDMYISLNEFYYEIGLEPIGIGDDMGWNIDNGYIDLKFSSNLTNEGVPCLVIDYRIFPKYEF